MLWLRPSLLYAHKRKYISIFKLIYTLTKLQIIGFDY